MIGFIAQCVLEHLTDTGHFVLAMEGKHHGKEGIKLGAFHDLGDAEDGLSKTLFINGLCKVDSHLELRHLARNELVFAFDGWDVVELGSHFIEIDIEAPDDV